MAKKVTSFAGVKDEDMDEVIGVLNKGRKGSDDDFNQRDSAFDPFHGGYNKDRNTPSLIQPIAIDHYAELGKGLGQIPRSPRDAWAEEEEAEELRKKAEDEKKKKQFESPYKEYFKDNTGNIFDPAKKFGII